MIVNLLPGLLFITSVGFFIALALGFTSRKYKVDENEIVIQVNQLLPQTQCAQCGHPGCKPYAEAIISGVPINRCPPGGEQVIHDLANLLGREYLSLDESFGITQPERIAKIRELECIGCTLCIQACPVDAILGASQQMHVVIQDQCTGCDLCLDPCPVDCIDMIEVSPSQNTLPLRPPVPRRGKTNETSCIRCGECEVSCPKQLAPQELFWQKSSSTAMQALNLDSCIECMICDRVCPSHIPLTNHFIATKKRLLIEAQTQERARQAESRFDTHSQRQQISQARVITRSSSKSRASILEQLKQSK